MKERKKKAFLIWCLVGGLVFLGLLWRRWTMMVPCGGMTEEGFLWDGTCAYGPMMVKNLFE